MLPIAKNNVKTNERVCCGHAHFLVDFLDGVVHFPQETRASTSHVLTQIVLFEDRVPLDGSL